MKRAAVGLGLIVLLGGSVAFAARVWDWVLNFDPGIVFAPTTSPTGRALTSSVTIVLVDGLRVDASKRMPTLNGLRARGADLVGELFTPSFSRPGRASIAVGAPPSIHGVTTNRQKRAMPLDNLIRRVAAMGGTCRVAGSQIWSGLFATDIARCGSFQLGESKEGPGAFVRQVPAVRSSQDASAAFVMAAPATLRIVDVVSTDYAAHEYGGTSREYADEVARADAWLSALVNRMDLDRETIVVTSDHGQTDAGGHGGEEPAVLAVPIVLAGKGIRAAPGVVTRARQFDIAATVAALLGAQLPAASSGTVIESALDADSVKVTAVRSAAAAQSESWLRAYATALGVTRLAGTVAVLGATPSAAAARDAHEIRDARVRTTVRRRMPWAIAGGLALTIAAVVVVRGAGLSAAAAAAAVVVFLASMAGPVRYWGPPLSFSSINYDEMLVPFFVRVIALSCATALISAAVAFLIQRRRGPTGPDPAARTLRATAATMPAVGLTLSVVLAIELLMAWLHHGLLAPATLPGADRIVEAFAIALSLAGISALTLAVWAVSPLDVRDRTRNLEEGR